MSYEKLILHVLNLTTSQNKSKKITKQKIKNTETQQRVNLIFINIILFSIFFRITNLIYIFLF